MWFCWWLCEKGGQNEERGQKRNRKPVCCLEMGGGWSAGSLPLLWYVCKGTNVHCGRWRHFKFWEIKQTECWPYQHKVKTECFLSIPKPQCVLLSRTACLCAHKYIYMMCFFVLLKTRYLVIHLEYTKCIGTKKNLFSSTQCEIEGYSLVHYVMQLFVFWMSKVENIGKITIQLCGALWLGF